MSQPRLVGRSSTGIVPFQTAKEQKQEWLCDPERDSWFSLIQQTTTHIGPYQICTTWDLIKANCRHQLHEVSWSSIDLARLGPTDISHASRPVTVWIGVEHGDIPWATVARVLRACKAILDRNGLEDVEVQMRVSCVFSLASQSPPGHDPLNEQLFSFSSSLLLGWKKRPWSRDRGIATWRQVMAQTGRTSESRVAVGEIPTARLPTAGGHEYGEIELPTRLANGRPTRIFMPSDKTTEGTIDVLRA